MTTMPSTTSWLASGYSLRLQEHLPNHLTEILRKQHPSVELRSVELLGTRNLDVGERHRPTIVNT